MVKCPLCGSDMEERLFKRVIGYRDRYFKYAYCLNCTVDDWILFDKVKDMMVDDRLFKK